MPQHPSVPAHSIAPAYTGRLFTTPVPALRLPEESMDPEAAYRFIHDELMLDGSSRLNLATFVTTWMDPEAGKLMAETFDKNMIDKDEYPVTAAIEQRCVCMVADLFHADDLRDDDPSSACGVSTIGSSEAVMLGGLAMKWRAVRRTGRTATVTVKVDTGLNRNGVAPAQYPAMLRGLRAAIAQDALRVRGLMSHMVYADQPDNPINDVQAQRLSEMLALARAEGVRFEVAHLANSAATMSRPDLAFDLVRPGIAVYGLSPVPGLGDMGLVPAMTVKCPVALVKSIRAGESVSYGHTWTAQRDTTLALLPIGYADGVFRSLGGRLEVLINGRRRPGAGRICMDQFMVDLGPGPLDVAEGDEAILFGPGSGGEPTAQDWADLLGTIHYEVVTSPRGRITRTYREAETVGSG
ncbi:alanine racemase [Mycobacterium interjectum]|uniref:alanine racemase n=1 Tax=Mycobacterium interjectum TaxID=33895 RepID=UPI001430C37A|nr:alanine racemase [Mycobacterium interjectum]